MKEREVLVAAIYGTLWQLRHECDVLLEEIKARKVGEDNPPLMLGVVDALCAREVDLIDALRALDEREEDE